MKRATREHLDDVFNFLAGRWLVGYKLTCFASSSNSDGRAMVTLFYFWLFPSCCNRAQGHLTFKDKLRARTNPLYQNLFNCNLE